MVVIGEIQKGSDIGRKSSMKFQWCACIGCGKERWVMMVRGKPETTKCNSCSKKGGKLSHAKLQDILPVLGETKRGRELGFKCGKPLYRWEACPNCGTARWVQVQATQKYQKCRKCLNKGRTGEKSGKWNGGQTRSVSGYIYIHLYPDSPYYRMTECRGYVMEHRLVMAKHLGRCLENIELVHHLNGNKTDNKIENLKLFACAQEHLPSMKVQNYVKKLESENISLKTEVAELKAQIAK